MWLHLRLLMVTPDEGVMIELGIAIALKENTLFRDDLEKLFW